MNERELRQNVATKKKAYDDAAKEGKTVEELRELVGELKEAREKLDLELEARGFDNPKIEEKPKEEQKRNLSELDVSELSDTETEERYTKVFLKAIRGKNLNSKDESVYERVKSIRKFQSAADEDGGLIIPIDVQTKINEFRR